MTISILAREANVPVTTVRFYERRGLIKPDARTVSNYRTYSTQTLERLKFLRAAQASGFNLKDIREMLSLTDSEQPPCKEVAELISNRLDDVSNRLTELKRIERVLKSALKSCCRGGTDWCDKIVQLNPKSSKKCNSAECADCSA